MSGWIALLLLSRVIVFTLALDITATSYRAYRRTGETTFQYAVVGFGMILLGSLFEFGTILLGPPLGLGSSLPFRLPVTPAERRAVRSVVFAIGFAALSLSIHGWRVPTGN